MPFKFIQFIVLALLFTFTSLAAEVSDADVKKRISDLQQLLINSQNADGSWNDSYICGRTALNLMALAYSGVKSSHPSMTKGIDFLLNNSDKKVYSESLIPCFFELVGPEKYRERIESAARYLENAQLKSGSWSYVNYSGTVTSSGDNSNTQFAVLGLAAAERCGITIDINVKKAALNYWLNSQRADGGWGYTKSSSSSTFSMTCAGVASLALLGEKLEKVQRKCGKYERNKPVFAAVQWIAGKVRGGSGLSSSFHSGYNLYALERVGIFLELKEFGGVDWYRRGAELILSRSAQNNAFHLLFLAKGFKSLAIAKWKWGANRHEDWNNDHYDVPNWVKAASKYFKKELDFINDTCDSLKSPASSASLLFANGHGKFSCSEEQGAFLRSFMDSGGTLVAEACCSKKAFFISFAQAMKKVYPGSTFRPVRADHSICREPFRLDKEDLSAFQLVRGCRKMKIFLIQKDFSCALNGDVKGKNAVDRAHKVAMNLLAFAMKFKTADKKLDRVVLKSVKKSESSTVDQLSLRKGGASTMRSPLGRLKHRGEYDADEHFFSNFNRALKQVEGAPEFDAEVVVSANSEALFDMTALFCNGHRNPQLSRPEKQGLKRYLLNGGFLMASSCCGSREFTLGFKKLIKELFPDKDFKEIPLKDSFYRYPFNLSKSRNAKNKAALKLYGRIMPPIYGLKIDGRWGVVFSPCDVCCGIEGDLTEDVPAFYKDAAFSILVNSYMQALAP